MSEEQVRRTPSWGPFAAAAAVAVTVLVVAVGWTLLAGGPSDVEQQAIDACEAALEQTDAPAIVGGEVYETPEYADYYAVVETHGEVPVPLDEVAQEMRDQWAQAATAYQDSGDGAVIVVWRLEDDTYRQCALPVVAGAVDASQAAVNELAIASENT
jgi:hypothetical protein